MIMQMDTILKVEELIALNGRMVVNDEFEMT
jgi:hypothetical protein